MSKLWTIVRYEVLMAWRRRSLPLIFFLLLAGVLGFTVIVVDSNQRWLAGSMQALIDSGQYTREQFNTISLFAIVIAGMVFYTVGVAAITGEVIPLDKQLKLHELINTTPLSQATYLGGKLLGAWVGIVLSWLGVGIIAAIAFRFLIGIYDLRIFMVLWFFLLLPAAFTAAALSVLFASFVNSRRMAVVVGLLVMPFVLAVSVRGMVAFVTLPSLISPMYIYSTTQLLPTEKVVGDTIYSLLIHAGAILVAWSLAWLFLRWRAAR